jgi:hypothetical protein
MKEPKNDYEALLLALRLAITAPTEEQSRECLALAGQLNISELEIERAKKGALAEAREEGR